MNLLDEKITKVFDFFVSSLLPMSVYLFYMFNEKIGAKFLALGELNKIKLNLMQYSNEGINCKWKCNNDVVNECFLFIYVWTFWFIAHTFDSLPTKSTVYTTWK